MTLTRPHKCDRFDCEKAVPEKRLALAIRTKATVAYCSRSCRAVTQQRRYRKRNQQALAAA
jgi:hypothetical protein